MPARIANDVFIADLRRVARKIGRKKIERRTLTKIEYDTHGRFASATIANRFGSWPDALRVVGLKPGKLISVSSADLLKDLRRVARSAGNQPFTREYYEQHGRYGAPTAARRFGSWNNAIRAAGLTPVRVKNVPTANLVADLQQAAAAGGANTLKRREYRRLGVFKLRHIEKRFGGWVAALRAAGLDPLPNQVLHRRHKKVACINDIITDLRRVANALHQQTLTTSGYEAHGQYRGSTIAIRFGCWSKALRAAGLVPTSRQEHWNVSNDALLKDVRLVARTLGVCGLSRRAYATHGRYGTDRIARRFESWTNAMRMAGLEPAHIVSIPNADLLADLQRVARGLGKRTLTKDEYAAHGGRYGGSIFAERFGSWAKALRTAGLEPKHEVNVSDSDLLTDIKRIAYELQQETIIKDEYDQRGRYSAYTIVRRFHSWTNAVLAAGLQPSWRQLIQSRSGVAQKLRALASIPGLTTEDQLEVAKTLDELQGVSGDVLLQMRNRMNLGPMELPSGIPSGAHVLERCIAALQEVQPDPKKLAPTNVLQKLGKQLHRAVAVEVLGREPLSPAEERRVAQELRQRKAA